MAFLDYNGLRYYHGKVLAIFKRISNPPIEVTFAANGWSAAAPYTQTVQVTSIKAADTPIPMFIDDGRNSTETKSKKKAYGCVSFFDSGNGQVTATCKYDKPTADFKIGLKGV